MRSIIGRGRSTEKNLLSPYIISPESNIEVMRRNEMITN